MVFLSDPGVSRGLRQPWVVPGYSLIFLMKVEMTEITIQAVNISTPVSAKMCGQQRGQWEEASLGLRLGRVLYPKFQFWKDGLWGLPDCTAGNTGKERLPSPRWGLSKALQPQTSAQFTWFSLTLLLASGTAKSGACKGSGSALSCDWGREQAGLHVDGRDRPAPSSVWEQSLARAT